ncbi:SUMF1/EgtB/PvdO family nonheme iron enzyme [Pseudoalteromonas denitrificans]|uniref:Formylglycine-generating enzyme, required for sulfatase activity, contains SUMF1/FGE domain n=1 Tax=Pseudoalteromonas denitrificans DSM 6059 TaxID=1123010 RepID=A0A1I1SRK2_9GAMM|nr:SUMF1/EgtB/PvdO family nonheme iron enzyme [Pseudoalteromonas denitrificans]SFD45700.1 Formylglycine-generating enzyme, required for sulfatase activity, contains SUMF1/FGE domain [Pseudoalteromonas denitrificans DSM 6059]
MNLNKIIMALCLSTMSYQTFAGSPIEPIMVDIPSGSFEMGSLDEEDAEPIHKVVLPAFSLGKYEVTVKEFRRFITATNYQTPTECYHQLDSWFIGGTSGSWDNNELTTSEFQPVNCIGWQAADAYVKWLAKETGKPYRLPSEAEWEYAARAGTKTKYFFGDDLAQTEICKYENTADLTGENILQRDSNSSYVNFANGKSNCVDHSAYASIVGMYKPNPFGLHDMISNVVEFLADCYLPNYEKAPLNGEAHIDDKCERRVTRGGSWHWNTFPLNQRGSITEDFIGGVEGFRVALDGKSGTESSITKLFKSELQIAQQTEQKHRDAKPDYPKPVTNLTIKQDKGMVTLNWDKSTEADVKNYRIYRNSGVGSLFKLLASNIMDSTFKDANADVHQYEYSVVAVRQHLQSDYSNFVATKAGGWVKTPERIEAESAVKISGTSVGRTSDVDGKYNLTGAGGISNEAKLEYQIDVAQSGEYVLTYRVASPRNTKGFTVFVNGKELEVQKVTETGGYHEWQTQQGSKLHLKKGKNRLTLNSLDNNWKLNWLALKQD